MKYKMVALDCDGTLLDQQSRIRPAVRDAVQEAIREGVLVTLATGRRFEAARHIAEQLDLRLPLVLHGGTIIQDSATGELIYEDEMPEQLLDKLIEEIIRERQQPVLYLSPAADCELLTGPMEHDGESVALYLGRQTSVRRLQYSELSQAGHVLSVAVFQNDDVLRPLYSRLSGWPTCRTLLWEPDPLFPDTMYLLDVVNAGCSKAKALAHLAGSYGIRVDEIMAIGDQINDVEMIESVGLGVAMGNAIEPVRSRARVVVSSNQEDGVAEALHKFVLNGTRRAG